MQIFILLDTMESPKKRGEEKQYLNEETIKELTKKYPELRKEIYMYFSYIHGENAIQELEMLIKKFFTKLQDNREKLKKTKEKNPEYYKKENGKLFKLTYNKYFGNKIPANIFENLLKILGTIGSLRKEQIRSSQKEIEQKKQAITDIVFLSEREKEFFMLAIRSPKIENRFLIDSIIKKEGVNKAFLLLKTVFIKYSEILGNKKIDKDRYLKKQAGKIFNLRISDDFLKVLKQIFALYKKNGNNYPEDQIELF